MCVTTCYQRQNHQANHTRWTVLLIMSKLSLDNLAKGIEFYSPESAQVLITFTDDSYTVSNFIAKYEGTST